MGIGFLVDWLAPPPVNFCLIYNYIRFTQLGTSRQVHAS